jgi:hypothetical protein
MQQESIGEFTPPRSLVAEELTPTGLEEGISLLSLDEPSPMLQEIEMETVSPQGLIESEFVPPPPLVAEPATLSLDSVDSMDVEASAVAGATLPQHLIESEVVEAQPLVAAPNLPQDLIRSLIVPEAVALPPSAPFSPPSPPPAPRQPQQPPVSVPVDTVHYPLVSFGGNRHGEVCCCGHLTRGARGSIYGAGGGNGALLHRFDRPLPLSARLG